MTTSTMRRHPSPRARQTRSPRSGGRQQRGAGAYRRLRELIVDGRLPPGTSLRESELSTRLGISRTPVREALARLQQDGLITRSGNGARSMVSALTADDMREVFRIVGALEGLAAGLAAALPAERRRRIAREMRRLNAGLRAATATRPPDVGTAKELHVRLHRFAIDAAAGPRLRAELDVLLAQWERYEKAYTSVIVHDFGESLAEHDALIDAIERGNPDAAERCTITNYRNGAERCQRVVAMLGERGAW